VHHRVALFRRDAQRSGEICALQALADAQFEDQLVAFVESAGCLAYE